MALPDYLKVELGTAIIWGEAGGAGVTHTMSLDALADGVGRMSVYADLGAVFDDEQVCIFQVETGTAPTAGLTASCYLVFTDALTRWPGGVSGSDAAWPGDSSEDEWALQLGAPAVVPVATNDGTVVQTQQPTIVRALGRYVCAVVDNNLGQAFRDLTPNSGNLSRVILIPRRVLVQDASV